MSIAEKLVTIAENQEKVYDAGKQAERIALWEAIQDGGKRTTYNNAFQGNYWTDENFTPLYPIIVKGIADDMFRGCGITDFTKEGVILDFSACTSVRRGFEDTKNTETKFPAFDFSNVALATDAFKNYWGKDLSLSLSEQFGGGNSFIGCLYLENLTISGTIGKWIGFKDSSMLTNESVQSIINALKDLTGATTLNLVLHPTVGAKLTDEQKATIGAKNWTLVY